MTSWRSTPLPKDWARTRARILRRDHGRCHVCKQYGATEVDHIKPASQGGGDDDANLAAIHYYCHRRKTARESFGGPRRREAEAHPGMVTVTKDGQAKDGQSPRRVVAGGYRVEILAKSGRLLTAWWSKKTLYGIHGSRSGHDQARPASLHTSALLPGQGSGSLRSLVRARSLSGAN